MDLTMMECPKCKGECELRIKAGAEFYVCTYCRSEVMLKKTNRLKIQDFIKAKKMTLGAVSLVVISLFALSMLILSRNYPVPNDESIPSITQYDGVIINVDWVRDIHAYEIAHIHIGDQFGWISFGSDDLGFEIFLRWLQEHQDLLLYEAPNYSQLDHNLELELFNREKFYFYTAIELFEEFDEFIFSLMHDVLVSSIDWHYLSDQFTDYIADITIQQDSLWSMPFASNEYDLPLILDFFAENQSTLNNESNIRNMFEVSIHFKMSDLNVHDKYINGISRFFIDESLHDQLWTLIEDEFGVMRTDY